jgi:hypothetical protein
MHRSGTSAATRLLSFLGLHTPQGDDLVPPSSKNPKGYWESMSLVAFNVAILNAIGSDFSCPLAVEPGWWDDPRLDGLRRQAPAAFLAAFPIAPFVWKDPRTCLTFSFWRSALDVRPVVVLVNRNPLEIVASSARARGEDQKVFRLASWERHLRQALQQIEGLPVLVTDYASVLSQPVPWAESARSFLTAAGVPTRPLRAEDAEEFIDPGLKHSSFTREDFLSDPDVSVAQKALYTELEQLEGSHPAFAQPALPAETRSTDALLAERLRAKQLEQELARLRESRRGARARRTYAGVRLRVSRLFTRADRKDALADRAVRTPQAERTPDRPAAQSADPQRARAR